ncbi:hypothetical protein MHYP_G00082150 [Metynnis hypsauchen]
MEKLAVTFGNIQSGDKPGFAQVVNEIVHPKDDHDDGAGPRAVGRFYNIGRQYAFTFSMPACFEDTEGDRKIQDKAIGEDPLSASLTQLYVGHGKVAHIPMYTGHWKLFEGGLEPGETRRTGQSDSAPGVHEGLYSCPIHIHGACGSLHSLLPLEAAGG